jgi:pSer/pThr/pTyr-binding forkhead associated (FHA) protein
MVLVVLIADMVVNEFPLENAALTIGRTPDNDIVLDDPLVSAHHARIDVARHEGGPTAVSIEDLGSTNGTRVNGKDVRKQRLKENDEIQIGRSALRVAADK